MSEVTLDAEVVNGSIELGRGNIISSKDIARKPGDYPIYSSSAQGKGEFGRYADYMFDEDLITWSVDGGGRFFFRSKHKFSVTNVSGYMRVNDKAWNKKFVYYSLDFQHASQLFDYQTKAHPSVIRHIYRLKKISPDGQSKIAEILSAVDQAIEQTEALIAKQQRIKTGLMQDLLTRGIDENGQLRTEQTHAFKDSPLGRIPVEWEVAPIEAKLREIIDYRGRTPVKTDAGIPLITAKNVREGYLSAQPQEFIAEDAYEAWMTRGIPAAGDVMLTTEAPMGNVARVPSYRIALAQRLITLPAAPEELSSDFLFWLLHWSQTLERLTLLTSGSTVVGIKQSVFRCVLFAFSPLEEQLRIAKALDVDKSIADVKLKELTKLQSLKKALMQDLLTGCKRVTDLLEPANV